MFNNRRLRINIAALTAAASLLIAITIGCREHVAGRPVFTNNADIQTVAARPAIKRIVRPTPTGEPVVRIRIIENQPSAQVDTSTGEVYVTAQAGSAADPTRKLLTPISITHGPTGFVLGDGAAQTHRIVAASVMIQPISDDENIRLNNVDYPGALVVHPGESTMRLDVVNHLDLEKYLPGVLTAELYANWPAETFRAQAIAARSYAIANWQIRSQGAFDLEGSTRSQAYVGANANKNAREAVAATRGQVMMYDSRVLMAFYSSCTGAIGQNAADVFGRDHDIPPLRARDHSAYSTKSPNLAWGPIERDATLLSRRIAAWGDEWQHPVRNIKTIRSVRVTERNSLGRPIKFEVDDFIGKTFSLDAEQFRFACNQPAPGLRDLPGKEQLKSSFVDVTVAKGKVNFTQGHGYGHGVGMGQWQAWQMAEMGLGSRDILDQFYPQSTLTKLY